MATECNNPALAEHAESLRNLSTNSEETLFRYSNCNEDGDKGMLCDKFKQWSHCSCERVSDALRHLFNLQETFSMCLSCRLLVGDDMGVKGLNSILTDGLSMRDPEGDDYVPQSLSRPATPATTT